jgi:hypothetical protein
LWKRTDMGQRHKDSTQSPNATSMNSTFKKIYIHSITSTFHKPKCQSGWNCVCPASIQLNSTLLCKPVSTLRMPYLKETNDLWIYSTPCCCARLIFYFDLNYFWGFQRYHINLVGHIIKKGGVPSDAYNTISSFSCFFTFIHKIKHLSSWKNENSKYDVMPFMEVYVHTTVNILQKENKKSLSGVLSCGWKWRNRKRS